MAVAALSFITLGIYFLYWWYQVNREMVDLGRARNAEGLGDNPTLSLLAMFPGGLVLIPPIFSMYNGVQRMKRAQEVAVGNVTMNGWIVFALYAGSFIVGVAGLIVPGYIQDELNKVWKAQDQPSDALPAAQPAATAPTPTTETTPTD
ncbi:MAG: DUF4234 domain-containing protein [Solirubrobacterales bacterium]